MGKMGWNPWIFQFEIWENPIIFSQQSIEPSLGGGPAVLTRCLGDPGGRFRGRSLLAASTISMLSIWVIHGYYMLLVVMNDADQQYIHHYLGD